MPRAMAELKGYELSKLKRSGFHPVGGVPGLYLNVTGPTARSWILRLSVGGRRREMGLGPYPEVGLAAAREKARAARELVRQGVDPVDQASKARSARAANSKRQLTFDACSAEYIKAHAPGWKNAKHVDQWANTLKSYASPVIGNLLVADVDTPHIVRILSPIWPTKTETASRVRGRIERVLGWATTSGFRTGDNPARWKGHLENLLPKRSAVAQVEHHAALPWLEVGAFMVELRKQKSLGATVLEFLILTATRSGEARGATWSEIDLDNALWTIPGTRMKMKKEHRVPLSPPVLAILRAQPRHAGTDLVFPGAKLDALSDMTLAQVMRRMQVDATPHGFRSTFRDWAAESTSYAREVVEQALAHAIESRVEAAYRRGDLLKKRARLMRDWATYCGREQSTPATVTPIKAA